MMNKYENKITRITLILERLAKGLGLSTSNLIDFFNVSKKIIQTDFKEYILPLFDDDTIVYDYSLKNYIANRNFLTATLLSAQELAIIAIIKAKTKDKYSDSDLSIKTDSLFARYEELLKNDIYQHSSLEKIDNFSDDIILIKNAINTKHVITCTYDDKEQHINPLKIIDIEGYWYLINLDVKDDTTIRTFHLNSMQNIQLLPNKFNIEVDDIIRKYDNSINTYFTASATSVEIVLFINKEIVKFFERKPLNSSQRVLRKYDDGNIDLEITISDFMEIIPTIQKYIPHIKVVEPQELSDRIEENLKQYFNAKF